jgi:putative transposase
MKHKKNLTSTDSLILKEIIQNLYDKKPLNGPDGIMTRLLKAAYEAALDGEAEAHINETKTEEGSNRRNGIAKKTVKSNYGTFELETPRDRNSTFEPNIIKKRQIAISPEIDDKILALYGLGASYEDISKYVSDMYGLNVSDATISSVTDKLLDKIAQWRGRPLEAIYPIIFMDAMFFKVRENGAVATKVMYNIMGINSSGFKEILGFYFCESEGASFWLSVLNDLKVRGVQDIMIACIDGLKGFPEAISASFPKTDVQLCIVHQIRNSFKMVPSKHQKEFISDLKSVYTASSKDVAESNLLIVSDKWSKYHMALKGWHDNWDNLSTYFKFSPSIRKLIYTTNPIEGFHRQIRKYTKTKGAFTSENALLKLTFCAINQITKKWSMPILNWAETISQLDLHFPNRL